MLRCASRTACLRACWWKHAPSVHHTVEQFVSPHLSARCASTSNTEFAARRLQFPDGAKIREPEAWTDLLEGGLPPHLRDHARPRADLTPNARDVAEILLASQRNKQVTEGIDLLFVLGFEKKRWDAVIWLVKLLVEAFSPQVLKPPRLQSVVGRWTSDSSLEDMTEADRSFQDIYDHQARLIPSSPGEATLDQLTGEEPDKLSQAAILAHDALGQIWRSLGLMVTACADTEMKPEILEIIAYLHHMEMMPSSIYRQQPSRDVTSIQQPPTLNLLSSRILISLSDAAWRANQRSNPTVTQAQSGWQQQYRLDQPGTRYRVNVAGLRPEVWLELLLWSCLHGGWIMEGTDILRALHAAGWKPFSWRSVISNGGDSHPDWDKLEYAFNTRLSSAMDPSDTSINVSVQKTISSEVINAYIDALANSTHVGVGQRGLPPGLVVKQLQDLNKFLKRGHLSLVAGSWDAILLRLADMHDHIISQRPARFERFATLSPSMGAELSSSFERDVPDYVSDGSAAILGLYHRALRARINASDVSGAFQLFQSLQDMADVNKRQSISDFIKQQQQQSSQDREHAASEMFTSNFAGIAYPAFEMQIPPTILGPVLELATDARAFDFARWLIYSKEVDGPVIPESLYADPAVAPALVRFASEMEDKPLLTKVVNASRQSSQVEGRSVPQDYIGTFFNSQVERRNWSGAAKVLSYVEDLPQSVITIVNLAHVARTMLFIRHTASQSSDDKTRKDFTSARQLFTATLQAIARGDKSGGAQIDTLLIVLSHANNYWAKFCKALLPTKAYHSITLPTKAFNSLLEGIVRTDGAAAGRRVVETFSSHPMKQQQELQRSQKVRGPDERQLQMSRFQTFGSVMRLRKVITTLTQPPEKLTVYGFLQPDLATIRLVFRAALDEAERSQEQGSEPEAQHSVEAGDEAKTGAPGESLYASAAWASRKLRSMGMVDEEILRELTAAASSQVLPRLRSQLSAILDVQDVGTTVHRVGAEVHAPW